MTAVIAPKKASLSDLFVVGKEITIEDGENSVTLYLKKLTEAEHMEATQQAFKASAQIQLLGKPSIPADHPDKQLYAAQIDTMESRDELIMFLCLDEIREKEVSIIAEMAANEEWEKDGYLTGLQAAWNDGLDKKWVLDPEDVDAKRVYDELWRYTEICEKEVEAFREGLVKDYEGYDEDQLRSKALEAAFKQAAEFAFSHESVRQQLYRSIRDPDDHNKLYLDSPEELGHLSDQVNEILMQAYYEMQVSPIEGKG